MKITKTELRQIMAEFLHDFWRGTFAEYFFGVAKMSHHRNVVAHDINDNELSELRQQLIEVYEEYNKQCIALGIDYVFDMENSIRETFAILKEWSREICENTNVTQITGIIYAGQMFDELPEERKKTYQAWSEKIVA